jgi:hypothetical protein
MRKYLKDVHVVSWLVMPCGLVDKYQYFEGKLLPPSQLRMKIEVICSSKTLISTYKYIWCYKLDHHRHLYCCENLKSHQWSMLKYCGSQKH